MFSMAMAMKCKKLEGNHCCSLKKISAQTLTLCDGPCEDVAQPLCSGTGQSGAVIANGKVRPRDHRVADAQSIFHKTNESWGPAMEMVSQMHC
jgi:hypothetical protein